MVLVCVLLFNVGCVFSGQKQVQKEQWLWYPNEPARQYQADCRQWLHEARKLLNELEDPEAALTSALFVYKFNQLDIVLDRLAGSSSVYRNLHPTPEYRAAAFECAGKHVRIRTQIESSRALYGRLLALKNTFKNPQDEHFLKVKIDAAQLAGAHLSDDAFEELQHLDSKLAELSSDFKRNVLRDDQSITVTSEALLDGVAHELVEQLERDKEGRLVIPTGSAHYGAIMSTIKHDGMKKDLYKNHFSRGAPKNSKILNKIIRNREDAAMLLQFGSAAQHTQAKLTLRDVSQSLEFLEQVHSSIEATAKNEYSEYLKALQISSPNATVVEDWRKYGLISSLKKSIPAITADQKVAFFKLQSLLDNLLSLTESLFNVTIEKTDAPVWDSHVLTYSVASEGNPLGEIYFDLYARAGKINQTRALTLQKGVKNRQPAIAVLSASFSAEEPSTTVISVDQLNALFFQYGKILSVLFNIAEDKIVFSGLPAQADLADVFPYMLQRLLWRESNIQNILTHNGQPPPKDLLQNILERKHKGQALFISQQLYYAHFALAIYSQPADTVEFDKMFESSQLRYSPFAPVNDTCIYCSFTLLVDMTSSYYRFLWAQAVAADLLVYADAHQLNSTAFFQLYLENLLRPINAEPIELRIENFLDRPLNYRRLITAQ